MKLLTGVAVALCLSIFSPSGALASVVPYGFSGAWAASSGTLSYLGVGTSFSGTYTHDDETQAGTPIDTGYARYSGGEITLNTPPLFLAGSGGSLLYAWNNYSSGLAGIYNQDGLFFQAVYYDQLFDPRKYFVIELTFLDNTGQALTQLSVPSHEELFRISSSGTLTLTRYEVGQIVGSARSTLQGFTAPTAIPEPGTLNLALLTLLILSALSGSIAKDKYRPRRLFR